MSLSEKKHVEAVAAATQAQADADDAQALLEELEERIATGDDSVTPERLDEQHRLARFAALHARGAAAKAAFAANVAAMASAQSTAAQAAALGELDEIFGAAWGILIDVIHAFDEAAEQRNAAIRDFVSRLKEHDEDLRRRQIGSIADHGVELGTRRNGATDDLGFATPATGLDLTVFDAGLALTGARFAALSDNPDRYKLQVSLSGGWGFDFQRFARMVPSVRAELINRGLLTDDDSQGSSQRDPSKQRHNIDGTAVAINSRRDPNAKGHV